VVRAEYRSALQNVTQDPEERDHTKKDIDKNTDIAKSQGFPEQTPPVPIFVAESPEHTLHVEKGFLDSISVYNRIHCSVVISTSKRGRYRMGSTDPSANVINHGKERARLVHQQEEIIRLFFGYW
jgi:hypothetical protein